ncbi:UDP-glucose dehydrogenase family protein [Candidatus Formimonas warabiya]|uniref:UDP-glucose 6-dehydrogenase n=1 Tax=Formimonas warabiya TaxID=1761012 RepID=A0A3G1KZ08_FORW1|nr:UDP-glucose/GDP-mannose dehydrogenase family protein [Candidatus Formimonas warabiya]ATW27718.1 UDP-glucose 6-dehydrogenase [Candidatus Formimonas warabiya]
MRISIIGTGYVGLVTGACLSEFGLQVTCMDINEEKIGMLKEGTIPIYEPGLKDIVEKNIRLGRLFFTSDIKETVKNSTVVFIAVGTPPNEDGSADLKHVLSAACSIAENMEGYILYVNKSTVPVGTGKKIKEVVKKVLKDRGINLDFDVVSNPEFLREGSAVGDFMHPDRIVIGAENEKAREIMKNVYHILYQNKHPFVFTNIETAELIKYASNAFLATKITFINEIANLCEVVGANVQDIARGMGLDERIGKYFLHAGPGYGGSCLPKDTKALVSIGEEWGIDVSIVDEVVKANDRQKLRMVDKIISAMEYVDGRKVAVLGLSYKPETDDMREAPSITIVKELLKRGAIISTFDPVAMKNAMRYAFKKDEIYYVPNEYDAVDGADALVIITEWNQFRSLDIDLIREKMSGRFFFDLRNIYDRKVLEEAGFEYYGVGR